MQDTIPLPAKRNPHLQNYFRSIRKIKHAVASPYPPLHSLRGRRTRIHRHLLSQSRSKIRGLGWQNIQEYNRPNGYTLVSTGKNAQRFSLHPRELYGPPFPSHDQSERNRPFLALPLVSVPAQTITYLHENGSDSVRTFLNNAPVGR